MRQRVEATANPEIAEAKASTLDALYLERGWRNAFKQIRECGGLEMPFDGAVKGEE